MPSPVTYAVHRLNWRVPDLIHAALAGDLPVAAWRSPQLTGAARTPAAAACAAQAVVDLSGAAHWAEIDFHKQAPGFVFSPFCAEPGRTALFVKADLYQTSAGLTLLTDALAGRDAWRWQRLQEAYARRQARGNGARPRWYTPSAGLKHGAALGQEAYCRLVRQAIAFIADSGIAKVVVSRRVDTPLPPTFDPVDLFRRLCLRYPNAFVSLVAIPGIGTWLGASPELLLAVDDRGLRTMALAGTQARPPDQPLLSVAWGPKERAEQAYVSAYVRDFFQRQGIADVQEHGPHTVAAGNLVHLQTTFRVDLPEPARLALANRVLHDLHPTSAVCGMPKDKALAFILAHEGYDRSFYSGFLGPMHIDGGSQLYVNLRCLQLWRDSASLYVGGGVTAASDPCAEWEETSLKAQTLLAALGQEIAPTAAPALERAQ